MFLNIIFLVALLALGLSGQTLSKVKETKFSQFIDYIEAGIRLTIPNSWCISSPLFSYESQNFKPTVEKVVTRFKKDIPEDQIMLTMRKLKVKEGVIISNVSLTEHFGKSESSDFNREVSSCNLGLMLVSQQGNAKDIASYQYSQFKNKAEAQSLMISPAVKETKINGILTYSFAYSQSFQPDRNEFDSKTYYFMELDKGVLILEAPIYKYTTDEQVKKMFSIIQRIKKTE